MSKIAPYTPPPGVPSLTKRLRMRVARASTGYRDAPSREKVREAHIVALIVEAVRARLALIEKPLNPASARFLIAQVTADVLAATAASETEGKADVRG
jgi:hypothetical protein